MKSLSQKTVSQHPGRLVVALPTICFVAASAVYSPQISRAESPTDPAWARRENSPHHSPRRNSEITAIIYHYTASGDLSGTIRWLQNPESRVSAHYVVGKDGSVVQMVPLDRAAWHAGTSSLAGVGGVNHFSIGIEIVNWGRLTRREEKYYTYTGQLYQGPSPLYRNGDYWEPYTHQQYESLQRLTCALLERYPIRHITGHSDVAMPRGRKIDPGPAFEWHFIKAKLPATYNGFLGSLSSP